MSNEDKEIHEQDEPRAQPDRGRSGVSRRTVLKGGALAGAAALGGATFSQTGRRGGLLQPRVEVPHLHGGAGGGGPVKDIRPGGFDPTAFATHFDTGKVSRLPDGRTLREYDMV
ncbi:MAG: twin-arginine translocation signal domain-containing protein, partial [Gemmatimonadota bacterium]